MTRLELDGECRSDQQHSIHTHAQPLWFCLASLQGGTLIHMHISKQPHIQAASDRLQPLLQPTMAVVEYRLSLKHRVFFLVLAEVRIMTS